MSKLKKKQKKIVISIIIVVAIVIVILSPLIWYNASIKAVDKNNNDEVVIEIQSGTSKVGIVNILKENDLIRNELAAKIFIKLNNIQNLQAGKYSLKKSESLSDILNIITNGNVLDESVTITFSEGKNMRYIVSKISENTNNTSDDVYNCLKDTNYINSLIEKYWFLTDDIKNTNIYYPLEGYLYPETYTFSDKDVSVQTIFEKMLDQMDKILSKYKDQITNGNYSVHKILSIASIVEVEGNNETNRKGISSVIYNRLKNKMAIGSDVTTYYAIKVDMGERELYAAEIDTYNAYNTRGPNMAGKLPVGPVSNPSEESINAALNPDKNNYLYFVADKNGKIYFSQNYEEHQKTITSLQKQGLWYEYSN